MKNNRNINALNGTHISEIEIPRLDGRFISFHFQHFRKYKFKKKKVC